MKKLLLIAATFFALHSSAKTPDTLVNNIASIAVQPVFYSISDTARVAFIGAYLDYDDLHSYANVRCFLFDSSGKELYNKYIKIEGEAYTEWEGSNEELFTILLTAMSLTRKEE